MTSRRWPCSSRGGAIPLSVTRGLAAIAIDPNTRTHPVEPPESAATWILVKRELGHWPHLSSNPPAIAATGGNPSSWANCFERCATRTCQRLLKARPGPGRAGAGNAGTVGAAARPLPDHRMPQRCRAPSPSLAMTQNSMTPPHSRRWTNSPRARPARRLAEEQVIVGERRLSFSASRSFSFDDGYIPGPSRADAHARAAAQLGRSGAPAERLAAHLLDGELRPVTPERRRR